MAAHQVSSMTLPSVAKFTRLQRIVGAVLMIGGAALVAVNGIGVATGHNDPGFAGMAFGLFVAAIGYNHWDVAGLTPKPETGRDDRSL